MYSYPFSSDEARAAHDEWGFNCGPAALSFALQIPIGTVRGVLTLFEDRGYVNPTMMKAALDALGRQYVAMPRPACDRVRQQFEQLMWIGPMSLVRIQWTGPWTANGKIMKWAARQTHWICCWRDGGVDKVFDINGGILPAWTWKQDVVPRIIAEVPRADGDWYPANIWRVR